MGAALAVLCTACGAADSGIDLSKFKQSQLPSNGTPGVCGPLASEPYLSDDGFASDEYLWYDSACTARRADLVRNTTRDPSGHWGGFMHRATYFPVGAPASAERTCVGDTQQHPGFGLVVNHLPNNVMDSGRARGTAATAVFVGKHHAIHEFTAAYPLAGAPLRTTIQWFFATGRDHPVFAITYDLTQAAANAVNADTRAPYGDIAWDGGADAAVDGVAWGDRYRFTTTEAPLSLQSGWDYTQPNTVPYVQAWARGVDAEMGLVQTQTQAQHDAGGSDFYAQWGHSSPQGPMPGPTSWPYQINQYELPGYPQSKRLAWGTNYGAVGQTAYRAFSDDRTLQGYPYQSYATHVVMGLHSTASVQAVVQEVEAAQATQLTAVRGATVDTQGPAGAGRTGTQAYEPAGYNPVRGTWSVTAGGGETVQLQFAVGDAPLPHPVLEINGWTGGDPSQVSLDGTDLVLDIDCFASVDSARQVLFLTLGKALSGTAQVAIHP